METALVDFEVSATSLTIITILSARLAGAWTRASSLKLSEAQGTEQQACSRANPSLSHVFNSLPTSHVDPSIGLQPLISSSNKAGLDMNKPEVQPDSTTISSSLPSGQLLSTEPGLPTTGSTNGSACPENGSAGFARVLGSMPLQQLQGLHRLLAGAAGASNIVSIFDDLHSGMFSMAPSHQLLPGAVACQAYH